MKTASHWADERKTTKIDPDHDSFGWDPDDMAEAFSDPSNLRRSKERLAR